MEAIKNLSKIVSLNQTFSFVKSKLNTHFNDDNNIIVPGKAFIFDAGTDYLIYSANRYSKGVITWNVTVEVLN